MAGEETKLWDDVKNVPSWVWLGGAAGAALLWVISRARGSSSASGTAASVPATQAAVQSGSNTSTLQDYGLYTDISNIQSELAAMQSYIGSNGLGGSSSGSGGNTVTGNPPTAGQVNPPTAPPPTPAYNDTLLYQKYSNGTYLLAAAPSTGGTQTIDVYKNGNWVPMTTAAYAQLNNTQGQTLGTSGPPQSEKFTGPGTYYGQQVNTSPVF